MPFAGLQTREVYGEFGVLGVEVEGLLQISSSLGDVPLLLGVKARGEQDIRLTGSELQALHDILGVPGWGEVLPVTPSIDVSEAVVGVLGDHLADGGVGGG